MQSGRKKIYWKSKTKEKRKGKKMRCKRKVIRKNKKRMII